MSTLKTIIAHYDHAIENSNLSEQQQLAVKSLAYSRLLDLPNPKPSYVSLWRPTLGWGCVAILLYMLIGDQTLPWIANTFGHDIPSLNPDITQTLLMAAFTLIMVILRTIEKLQRVSS